MSPPGDREPGTTINVRAVRVLLECIHVQGLTGQHNECYIVLVDGSANGDINITPIVIVCK